jgi:hypothetical protein
MTMATTAVEEPTFVSTLRAALKQWLADNAWYGTVEAEPVGGETKYWRFFVMSDGLEPLTQTERQSLVWREVDRSLAKEDSLKVSMIVTLTLAESGFDD